MFYVYFIESLKNHKIYVGSTSIKPEARLEQHNQGHNKYTSINRPFKLLYFETYLCKTDALNREKFYKMGFGRKIKDIIVKYLSE